MTRPSWDEYFISIVDATALRASCDRGKSAAVIVKDKRVVSCGYVGAPMGLPDCDEVGHDLWVISKSPRIDSDLIEGQLSDKLILKDGTIIHFEISIHCLRTVHSELNAILNAARNGVSCLGATMYCTMVPCRNCAMAIIQSGIIKVVAKHPYQKQQDTIEMFKKVGIKLDIINDKELY